MIEHCEYATLGPPPFSARERAVVDCGCCVYVGLRMDTDPAELAANAVLCCPPHRPMLQRFAVDLTATLANGTDRLLIGVVDEVLAFATEHGDG